MQEIQIQPDTLRIWTLITILVFLKMFANSLIQGLFRFKQKSFVWPEDNQIFKYPHQPKALDNMQRINRVWANDLENFPIFLFLGLGYTLLSGQPDRMAIYGILFVSSRIFHTVFFLIRKQPHRNLSYQIGLLTCFALSAESVLLLLR